MSGTDRRRHRRHVHRRDADRRGDRARLDRQGAARRRPTRPTGFMAAVERALAEGEAEAAQRRLRRPRDDRRDERDHRGQDRAQRLRHDRRLPRPARDRAAGAADALRHAVREAAAARAARPRRRRASSGSGRRARCCCRSTTSSVRDAAALLRARGRRVGRRLPAPLLRQPGARAARRRDPRRGAAGRAGLALGRGRARVPRVPARVDDRDQRRDPAGRRPLPRADRAAARRRPGSRRSCS